MTLDAITELARNVVARGKRRGQTCGTSYRLARFVLDTLGAQMPCGFDEPRVIDEIDDPMSGRGDAHAVVEFDGATYAHDEALGIGAAFIRAALAAKAVR